MYLKRHPCKYNLIRFQPVVDADEFANVGVVLVSMLTYELHFKLLPTERTQRVLSFFEPLQESVLIQALDSVNLELTGLKDLLAEQQKIQYYDYRVVPRDGLISYSSTRAILTETPESTLEQLYYRYIERKPFNHLNDQVVNG